MKHFDDFTHLYSLSKTLRFEARPVGSTLEHIIAEGLLDEDETRAADYQTVKKIIDRYHKAFIDNVMDGFHLNVEDKGQLDSLSEYLSYYLSKSISDGDKEKFEKTQANLRKSIAKALTGDDAYKNIFKKELIKDDLLSWSGLNDAEKAMVEKFSDFTTYFTGFHENRKNMYSEEEKSTAIAYRLIHDNLPKFVDNISIFGKIEAIPEMRAWLTLLYEQLGNELTKRNIAASSISEMFRLSYYNNVLTQRQIDVYNLVIGGKSEDKLKIKGLNEYINLYNQQHKDAHLPKLRLLYKQILSDRNAISWLPEAFSSDKEALVAIKSCYGSLRDSVLGNDGMKQLLSTLDRYDTKGVYVTNDLGLTDISQKLFGSWSVITNAVMDDIKSCMPKKKKEDDETYDERARKKFKSIDSFSIEYLDHCLKKTGQEKTLEEYFAQLGAYETATEQHPNHFIRIANAYTEVADLLESDYPKEKNLAQDKGNVAKIKDLLDAIKDLQHFVKPLLGKGNEDGKDETFYGELAMLWTELDKVTPLYNMVRNYMTRKPYSQEKIKLNFKNSTLMDGWDQNKEHDNTTVILRKDNLYYLAIMNKRFNKVFDAGQIQCDGDCYEKMVYKLLPGANKMLPKVFFSKSRIDEFQPSDQLKENYDKGTHKKGRDFNIDDCHALIEFFKVSIEKHEDWRKFDFHFSETESYEDLSGFYREVEQQGYKITFDNVSTAYIDKLVDEGKLYLFQIYNKDFSPNSKGTPNMHTLYWRGLFSADNLANVVYKLNGQGEIFYRKSSLQCNHPTHAANHPIKNKNGQNVKKESVFSYDLIKDRRYTVDKFMFHVPITINFKSTGNDNINQQVREYLQSSPDAHIIGIDRGERHLLYLVVIDQQGRIKEQCSLNEIVSEYNGNTYRTDYHALLDRREKERQLARGSWQTIESIKELKEGYLSQVVHKITEWMVKYHAIVVLEDLNMGFMRGRQKVEKSVYQKFEKMLIDKLNYMVDKKADPVSPGGLLNAYQLTSKFESFQKLGKQSGFLFYIPAWNTSKIDPVTGFVNLLDTRYTSIDNTRAFIGKFSAIRYNAEKDWLEFSFDYDRFTTKAQGTRTLWTLCTQGERIKTFRNPSKNNEWDNVSVNLTHEFKKLFADYGISLVGNLKEIILSQNDKSFFEQLLSLLKLTLQLRNSITGTQTDYLVSPVADDNGCFYDSRTCGQTLPANADANGAYNIARKGLMMVRQIQLADDLSKLKFDLSNKAWLRFAQEKPYEHE